MKCFEGIIGSSTFGTIKNMMEDDTLMETYGGAIKVDVSTLKKHQAKNMKGREDSECVGSLSVPKKESLSPKIKRPFRKAHNKSTQKRPTTMRRGGLLLALLALAPLVSCRLLCARNGSCFCFCELPSCVSHAFAPFRWHQHVAPENRRLVGV